MSNPGILPGISLIPAQQFGVSAVEQRYPNHQFNGGDIGKTLALIYGLAGGFWLPHRSQCFFRWGSMIAGYNPSATDTVIITPRSGVNIYVSGVPGSLSTLNIQPKAQFVLFKEDDDNTWIASGTGIY